ncbi:unnamed protein product [Trichobilharzia regenti]|nr:unnamed protein product [Trichobilharzia regenti]
MRFHGALNNTELLRSCISPCGTFLFSGSEDENVYVWNVNTGDQVEIYENLLLPGSVTSISYHPTGNVIAFSAVGPDSPVIVYAYDIKDDNGLRNCPSKQPKLNAPFLEKLYLSIDCSTNISNPCSRISYSYIIL